MQRDVVGGRFRDDPDFAPVGVLHGVVQEVLDGGRRELAVRLDEEPPIVLRPECESLRFGGDPGRSHRAIQQLAELDVGDACGHLPGLQVFGVQDALDQSVEPLGIALDELERVGALLGHDRTKA